MTSPQQETPVQEPSFPVHSLRVRPWADPVVEAVGHDAGGKYVERFWLGVLGPSSTWLLRLLADGLNGQPEGFEIEMQTAARSIGLGMKGGQHSPFMRSLARCCQFGLARFFDERTLLVRQTVPPLSARQLAKLPESLQTEHLAWTGPAPQSALERLDHARRMALTLLELGDSPQEAESQLHRWQIHPAIAHAAVQWARGTQSDKEVKPAQTRTPGPRRIPPPPTFVARPTG